MHTNKLKWLSLMGLLGLLSIPLRDMGFSGFFGFFGFMGFNKADERDEVNLHRAAWLAYIIDTFGFCILLVVLGVSAKLLKGQPDGPGTLAAILATGIGTLYFIHILTFLIGYSYYDRKGE